MNYDKAHMLANEIKNSDEYKNYKKAKALIDENLELKQKLDNFEKARYEVQLASIQGLEADKEKAVNMQNLYLELIQNETMKDYFDAELKFNIVLTDINKIIGDSVQELLK